jgi:ribosomal protein S18 acetylase RimI-like enzyme
MLKPESDSRTITDKTGRTLIFGCCSKDEIAGLVEMYDAFQPKAITQGLPPMESGARRAWIEHLLDHGQNFQALHGSKVIGHSCLITTLGEANGEYVIFVHHEYRHSGVGTELTILTLKRAHELCLREVWLTVEALNFRAIKLYRKVGFQFCDCGERERTMMLRL